MTRIYVSNGCAKLYKDITNALDASYIDYDMDGYDRYMVNEDDADEVIDIMESLGADAEIM